MKHPIVDLPVSTDVSALLNPVTEDNAPFWQGLEQGEFHAQQCAACNAFRLPPAPVCPHCGATAHAWQPLSGRGEVFSWVRYHRGYLPELNELLPYCVAIVALEEGPRLPARLINLQGDPFIGMRLRLLLERWPGGRVVPVFESVA